THAALQSAVDGSSGVGMTQDVDIGGFSLFYRRANLVHGELGTVHAVRRRRDAAAEHEFDVLRAALDLLAHGAPHVCNTVAHHRGGGVGVAGLQSGTPTAAPVA